MTKKVTLTGIERSFGDNEIIVSKTDLKGRITYANTLFLSMAGYAEADVIGQPHSLIRHPDMPRCVFKLLWDTLQSGRELFAYVINRSANGDHYWVLAHATPSRDGSGAIVGYHSNRRTAAPAVVERVIAPLYRSLCECEDSYANAKEGMAASYQMLTDLLAERNQTYSQFVFSLITSDTENSAA